MDLNSIQQTKQRYGIIGNSEGLNRAIHIATQVAPTDVSVLIIGESGVGKEVLPKIIHDNSSRKHNNYFAINCGSIPEGTIDSELFGHKKGAFTGSVEDREGYFSVANNGTLFLDEVGELPLSTQARLLRVLETGEYIRVGDSEVRKTNVRIVAATNVNMQKAIKEGKFREDLYYRLNTVFISLPPLRERGNDIILLFRKFAYDISTKYRFDAIKLTEDAKDLMLKYKWPGNIRQLRNLAEQLSIISQEREITADILMKNGITDDSSGETGIVIRDVHNQNAQQQSQGQYSYETERTILFQILNNIRQEMAELKSFVHEKMAMPNDNIMTAMPEGITIVNPTAHPQPQENIEFVTDSVSPYIQDTPIAEAEEVISKNKDVVKENIIRALNRFKGNRKKAANELGIAERTLYRKIKEYGLDNN